MRRGEENAPWRSARIRRLRRDDRRRSGALGQKDARSVEQRHRKLWLGEQKRSGFGQRRPTREETEALKGTRRVGRGKADDAIASSGTPARSRVAIWAHGTEQFYRETDGSRKSNEKEPSERERDMHLHSDCQPEAETNCQTEKDHRSGCGTVVPGALQLKRIRTSACRPVATSAEASAR